MYPYSVNILLIIADSCYFDNIQNIRYLKYLSKVSTRFAYFFSGFASETVLILILIVLDAEFYALSIDVIFRGGHRAKIGSFLKILI